MSIPSWLPALIISVCGTVTMLVALDAFVFPAMDRWSDRRLAKRLVAKGYAEDEAEALALIVSIRRDVVKWRKP